MVAREVRPVLRRNLVVLDLALFECIALDDDALMVIGGSVEVFLGLLERSLCKSDTVQDAVSLLPQACNGPAVVNSCALYYSD